MSDKSAPQFREYWQEKLIRDAVSAVQALAAEDPLFPYIHVEDAIATIEALGDKR